MQKTEFLTIIGTYGKLKTVKKTLPSIIKETKHNDAKLIVHDSTEEKDGRHEKWKYLQDLNTNNDFFLILSDNMSMAHARNMCLQLGQELYCPDYICMLEDDHGMNDGFIKDMVFTMGKYYGKESPNGLRYGLFTGCNKHIHVNKTKEIDNIGKYPLAEINKPGHLISSVNSCCRCAPTHHWINVLKGYDTDEYLISTYQTKNLVFRNYNKGFTFMLLGNGEYMFSDETVIGRGSSANGLRLWDEKYTAIDNRSKFKDKGK